jgi:hypothetical protein
MMEAVRTSETSVDNHFRRQYILEDNCEHHIRRCENLKSHKLNTVPHSHQSPQISSERHEANKNHNSQEPEAKMGSKKTAWTVSMEPG